MTEERHEEMYQHYAELDRDSRLFGDIESLEAKRGEPVPEDFAAFLCQDEKYEEPHYGSTQETPYGQALLAVRAANLAGLLRRHAGSPLGSGKNRAAAAYIAALPITQRVALYWH